MQEHQGLEIGSLNHLISSSVIEDIQRKSLERTISHMELMSAAEPILRELHRMKINNFSEICHDTDNKHLPFEIINSYFLTEK